MTGCKSPCFAVLAILAGAVLFSGCSEETVQQVVIKSPDEPLTASEWDQFERIANDLGPEGLADLAAVFPPVPDWQPTRTLSVMDLMDDEQRLLNERWNPQFVSARLSQRSGLARLLRREQLTTEQFAGLALAVSAAAARSHLPENEPPDEMLRRGRTIVETLQHDQRLFSSMDAEDRYHVLDQAIWLHRLDRVQRLRTVPVENVTLVAQHAEWIAKMLPACFCTHPLADVADLLGEQGLPFTELPESGSDTELDWDPTTAIGAR